ncbi:hypothetical protein FC65_GL000666 [Ligilactobacillus acidipiscis DSM 15836]|uniref:HTH cro/C1-type domain-containing protein n=1 Tax=Ligilactobacillus acidipiscis DSM 15836 TaxID=1423716 RepID=A0ABR5PN86_9LACO|nr:helix-turn-helix transcriptional regulator [Ligilactobacillus acidipiscis]KRM30328.1 hypothetical protein FC65_GL000666 [Ligilactobacillus acidipiscis DSM 15836]GAW63417.1 XRE family transcriptional regulator [Ligilactobacillus acidipiscis]GEN19624.1 transcriptional regulator [Ligilactobacillus acidipiscis]
MGIYERIKELAKKRDLSINKLEEKLGFARGYLYTWKNKTPGIDKVEIVADFFHVSTDYLLGRTDQKEIHTDNRDPIDKMLDEVMSYDGQEPTENDRQILRRIIEAYLKNKK